MRNFLHTSECSCCLNYCCYQALSRKYFARLVDGRWEKCTFLLKSVPGSFFLFSFFLNFISVQSILWPGTTVCDARCHTQFYQSCQETGLSHNWMKQQDRKKWQKRKWWTLICCGRAPQAITKIEIVCCHWQWILQCSVFVENDFADDETKLNTQISLQNLEGTLVNFAGAGQFNKGEQNVSMRRIQQSSIFQLLCFSQHQFNLDQL